MSLLESSERAFERWGHLSYAHPWKVISLMILVTAALFVGVAELRTDVSTESYLREDDPARVVYNEFRHQFGYDDDIVLIIQGDDIFSLPFLEKLRGIHADLEAELPSIDSVESLISARVTRGEGDVLIVEDLFERWPETEAELAVIKARALANPTYENLFYSKDYTSTAVRVRAAPAAGEAPQELDAELSFGEEADLSVAPKAVMLEGEELNAVVEAMYPVIERYESDDFQIAASGGPPITYAILSLMQRDMGVFTVVSNLIILTLLALMFRRFSGVFLPWVVVALPLLATFGAMGFLDLAITPSTNILPSLLLAVCVGDGVHILSVFFDKFDQGLSKEEAISFALGHSGLAVVMTSITTAGSLFSFAFADLKPLQGLGMAAPIGILFALVYAVVLLPSLIAVMPMHRRAKRSEESRTSVLDRILLGIGDFSTGRPWTVLVIWFVLVCSSLYGGSQIHFTHAPHKWFPEGHPVSTAFILGNEVFDGTLSMDVVIDSGEENGLYDPGLLKRLDELHRVGEAMDDGFVSVGNVISVVDVIKETNQALNGNDKAFYSIPESRELVAQEMLLFENAGTDDLESLVDPQFQRARMTLILPFEDSLYYIDFVKTLEETFTGILGGKAKLDITGQVVLYARTIGLMLTSTAKSYTIAILIIIPLMILLIGNVRMGLLSLIPNLAPIIMGMGLMFLLDVNLDLFTIMIGSIAIGVAVDDTIHFMHNYGRYYKQSGDSKDAVHKTLQTTGRALLITSLALSSGFFAFLFATMTHVQGFGLITGLTILTALMADLMLSPAIVVLADRFSRRGSRAR